MHFFPHVLTGALLCNSLPHLAAGLRGEPFPTPFARPRGIGPSSPLVNFYWGALNLLLGVGLLAWSPLQVGLNVDSAALVLARCCWAPTSRAISAACGRTGPRGNRRAAPTGGTDDSPPQELLRPARSLLGSGLGYEQGQSQG